MKLFRTNVGPFRERPHFDANEIEDMCTAELRSVGLYPSSPGPIRIERFIEKRFGLSPAYEKLPEGVLGYTEFGQNGVAGIVISDDLEADPGTPTERRLRATLAHEAGHGLLHASFIVLGAMSDSLLGESANEPHILCRDLPGEAGAVRGYDGRWWEFQANKAIGGLLIPRRLALQALQGLAKTVGSFGQLVLPDGKREAAIKELSKIFDVNPAVAQIRLAELMASGKDRQLSF